MPRFCRATVPQFLRETRSTTALEFAMIGSVFFLFIFAIFVFSLDQFWQMALDDAVRNAAREVQTGKVTSGAGFVTAVCAEFGLAAPGCATALQYSVQTYQTYSLQTANPVSLNPNGSLSSYNMYSVVDYAAADPTAATAIAAVPEYLVVQAAYPIPIKIFIVPGGVATENGTSSLYSVATLPEMATPQ